MSDLFEIFADEGSMWQVLQQFANARVIKIVSPERVMEVHLEDYPANLRS